MQMITLTAITNIFTQIGLKTKCCSNKSSVKPKHWLDPAVSKFGPEFVSDARAVLSASSLFLLYPPFWALFSQQGSKWTFQVSDLHVQLLVSISQYYWYDCLKGHPLYNSQCPQIEEQTFLRSRHRCHIKSIK